MRMLQTLLTTHDVSYGTSTQELFSKVSLTIKEHDRIALIGKNGTGKTTFLKILSGMMETDSGTVMSNGSVGYVPQVSGVHDTTLCVSDLLPDHTCTYERFCEQYERIFSSSVPARSAALRRMSGGEITKLWIALVAARNPSVLLLDEPTNHLDLRSIEELEEWIGHFAGAVVFVSHNRTFLSRVALSVWELRDGVVTVFGGSYAEHLQKKRSDAEAMGRKYEATKKELRALHKGERMRETKAARAAKVARQHKHEVSRSRGAEHYFKDRSEKGVGKIKQKHNERRSELKDSLESLRPQKQKTIHMPLDSKSKGKRLLLETTDLSVCAGTTPLVEHVDLRIEFGDRLSISGDNGTGKTLLLASLMHEIKKPTGGVSKVGTNVTVEFIDQQYDIVDQDLTLFENLEKHMPVVDAQEAYKQMGRFQFPEQYAHKAARELSGGEVARLAFAIATIAPVDLLVLDEPTNNLDIETVDVIVAALNDFKGSLVVVTHDVSFLEALAIERTYQIVDGVFRPG